MLRRIKRKTLTYFHESRARLLTVLTIFGLLVTGLQFFLVSRQVDLFLANQNKQLVLHNIGLLERRLNQDQYFMDAVAALQESNPNISEKSLYQFITIADHGQSAVAFIYKIKLDENRVETQMLHNMNNYEGDPPDIQQKEFITSIADILNKNARPTIFIMSPKTNDGESWLVFINPLGKGEKKAILGIVPLKKLFGFFFRMKETGHLLELIVSETSGRQKSPFLVIKGSDRNTFTTFYQASEFFLVRDHAWIMYFRALLKERYLLVALLPYLTLGMGLFLTWGLVFYIGTVRTRGQEIAKLADSLRKANEELSMRVSEEARMAQAVRESEQKYRGIFENAGIGIFQIAPTGEWLNANRKMATILGYAKPQQLLLAQPDLHNELFVDPDDRQKWIHNLNEGKQEEIEFKLYKKDREIIWVNMNGHVVRDSKGEPVFFECTMYDITERRKAELALRRAIKEADFANRSKSEFLANMSHELRTPLNAIIGFSEIIRDQLFGPVGQPQYVEYARDIHDSGDLLLSLINDILDMSKIEAGKRELSESEINITDIVRSVTRLVSVRAKSGRVKLVIDLPQDMPYLRAEEKALKQILTNLMTNAIKFTPEGGTVTLAANVEDDGRWAFRIEDTGIGMKPEDIPVALAPFGQIESVLSRKNQGTGLGLPLTKALIELHGGEMKLQSELGKGTSITVLLPSDRILPRISALSLT